MAKGTKPGTKPEAQEVVVEAAQKKSTKKLIIIVIALLSLLVAGAVAAFLLLKPQHSPEQDAAGKENAEIKSEAAAGPPKFIDLGTFTTNLAREDDADRYVQVSISLKINRTELEEQINNNKPEILHRVNLLLQSKQPSELATPEGKTRLADQIKVHIQQVLGLRKNAPAIGMTQEGGSPTIPAEKVKGGLDEVLFTTFLIQ
jgi:flagellar FliL protein